jgi:hypothetical protein
MRLKNSVYDVLKYIVTIVLPALTTLWLALATIWNLPYGEPIGATMGAITVFLGALIGISSAQYNKEKENDNEQQ